MLRSLSIIEFTSRNAVSLSTSYSLHSDSAISSAVVSFLSLFTINAAVSLLRIIPWNSLAAGPAATINCSPSVSYVTKPFFSFNSAPPLKNGRCRYPPSPNTHPESGIFRLFDLNIISIKNHVKQRFVVNMIFRIPLIAKRRFAGNFNKVFVGRKTTFQEYACIISHS